MIPVLLLWLLAVIGVPVFALFAAAALGLLLDAPGGGWEAVAIDVFGAKLGESPTLMTVPLLVFAGQLLSAAGMAQRLQELARSSFGRLPGAVAAAAWLACASSTTLAVGPTVAGCAVLLLPSLIRLREQQTAVPPAGTARARQRGLGELGVPLVFAASLALGLRPFEGATLAVFAAVVVAARTRGRLVLRRELPDLTLESVITVGVVLAVAITAIGFDAWLVHADASAPLLAWLDDLQLSRVAFLLLANALLLAGCWLLDLRPALLLLAPLLLPVADHYLVDVYELAAVFLFNAELARLVGWPPARQAPRALQNPPEPVQSQPA